MKNILKIFSLIILVLFIQSNTNTSCEDKQAIIPDLNIQEQMNCIAYSAGNQETLFRESANLKNMERDVQHILQQVVYFRANALKMRAKDEISSRQMGKVTAASYVILKEFLTLDEKTKRLSSESAKTIINAVVPHLGTKDHVLRKQLYWLLEGLDRPEEMGKPPVFDEYKLFIESRKNNPPIELIKYMYETKYGFPGEALLTLMDVYTEDPRQKQTLTQKEKIVDAELKRLEHAKKSERYVNSEAMNALNELSKDKEWWVRLYVAEIVSREPEFKSSEISERLKNDENQLVREVISPTKVAAASFDISLKEAIENEGKALVRAIRKAERNYFAEHDYYTDKWEDISDNVDFSRNNYFFTPPILTKSGIGYSSSTFTATIAGSGVADGITVSINEKGEITISGFK